MAYPKPNLISYWCFKEDPKASWYDRNNCRKMILYPIFMFGGLISAIVLMYVASIALGFLVDAIMGTHNCNESDYLLKCWEYGWMTFFGYLVQAVFVLFELGLEILLVYGLINSFSSRYLKITLNVLFTIGVTVLPATVNVLLGWLRYVTLWGNNSKYDDFKCTVGNLRKSLNLGCMMDGLIPYGFILMGVNVLIVGVIAIVIYCTKCCDKLKEERDMDLDETTKLVNVNA